MLALVHAPQHAAYACNQHSGDRSMSGLKEVVRLERDQLSEVRVYDATVGNEDNVPLTRARYRVLDSLDDPSPESAAVFARWEAVPFSASYELASSTVPIVSRETLAKTLTAHEASEKSHLSEIICRPNHEAVVSKSDDPGGVYGASEWTRIHSSNRLVAEPLRDALGLPNAEFSEWRIQYFIVTPRFSRDGLTMPHEPYGSGMLRPQGSLGQGFA
jgi:hypothetical protein